MNVRERAAHDAKSILNDLGCAGTSFFLTSNTTGKEYQVAGSYGDIGYMINASTGQAVEGRTIEASFSLLSLAEKTEEEPQRGWEFRCIDISGKTIKLFITKFEPDRTIGVGRVQLGIKLQ